MGSSSANVRIDLHGVPLDDEDGRTTAIFLYRTTAGLVLSLPESVDVTVGWADLSEARLDLMSGEVRVAFRDPARYPWLGRARILTGRWTDRALLTEPPT